MKRSPALASLSRDHHQALVVAQTLLRAKASTADQVLADLGAYWDQHGQAHFRAEEEVLLPAYAAHADPYDPLLAKVLCDHLTIRQRIQGLAANRPDDLTALHELGRLLNEHVRREEGELFPLIEAALPEADLAAVARALDPGTTTAATPDNAPVELDGLRGLGPVWGVASEDLNATVLAWEAGQGVPEHTNAERDVLIITIAGSGVVAIDGREHRLRPHHAFLIAKGTRRGITAGAAGLRYVSVHWRREPLQIEPSFSPCAGAGRG